MISAAGSMVETTGMTGSLASGPLQLHQKIKRNSERRGEASLKCTKAGGRGCIEKALQRSSLHPGDQGGALCPLVVWDLAKLPSSEVGPVQTQHLRLFLPVLESAPAATMAGHMGSATKRI